MATLKFTSNEVKTVKKRLLSWLLILLIAGSPGVAYADFHIISKDAEVSTGLQMVPKFESEYGGIWNAPAAQDQINQVGKRLLARAGNVEVPYSFKLLNSSVINAFCAPGGKIYITAGMWGIMDTEDEVAAVMAHEIGHEQRDHWRSNAETQIYAAILAKLIAGDNDNTFQILFGVASLALSRGYGFKQEHEADQVAFELLTAAGYNPGAAAVLFRRFYDRYGDGGGNNLSTQIANYINPHPKNSTRIERQLGFLQQYSGGKVRVDGSTVFLNGVPVVTPGAKDNTSPAIRAYFAAGRLATLSSQGKLNEPAYYSSAGEIAIGDQVVLNHSAGDPPPQAIVSAINSALGFR